VIQPHAESILRQEASIRKRLNKLKLRERKKSHGCAVPGRAGGGGRAHDTSTTSPSSKSETASRRDDEGRGGEDGMRVSDAVAASDRAGMSRGDHDGGEPVGGRRRRGGGGGGPWLGGGDEAHLAGPGSGAVPDPGAIDWGCHGAPLGRARHPHCCSSEGGKPTRDAGSKRCR
jgi:hypothetical protein